MHREQNLPANFLCFWKWLRSATIFLARVEPTVPVLKPFIGLLYQLWMIYEDFRAIGGMND
jgi:hypothetical protein